MELGMIGLGRVGANMTHRRVRDDHRVVGFDSKPEACKSVEENGAESSAALDRLVANLAPPRAVADGACRRCHGTDEKRTLAESTVVAHALRRNPVPD